MNGKRHWPDRDVFSQGMFSALPEREWRSSSNIPDPKPFDKKSLLFRDGAPARHVFLIGEGLVKAFKSTAGDRIQIVNILGPGEVVGAKALTRSHYSESAATLSRSLLFKWDKTAFLDFVSTTPALSVAFIELLNSENAALQSLLCDLGTKKALPRVASCLLLFMKKQVKPGETRPFQLPISRQEMGAFLGLSPETVSRQLKDLTSSRVIRLDHRRLTVLNLDHLRSIAQV
ncbi:MAG: Crp/Fnr family transcriptional regulator [Candidatus Latescibacterota bacterium]|jgi:CRP/FNR family transcriptional regulator